MKKLGGLAVLLTGVALGVGVCALLLWNPLRWMRVEHLLGRAHEIARESRRAGKTLYTCGMHPQVIEDKPGYCPICGMRLVPLGGTWAQPANGERKILYWRAPMDPNFISDKPGKSPMGMDLIPVYDDEAPEEGGVRVNPSFLQNFGVTTTEVKRGSLPKEIRTVGVLAHNERNIISVRTKFEGWIEKAHVANVGEHVDKGALLFEIYSPQLVTTQQEYLAALDYVARLRRSQAYADAIERAESLRDAARERLRYWDISDEQIDELDRSKTATRTLKYYSPASGSVVAKMGDSFEGMKVDSGMTLLKLASHKTLWVEGDFYESDVRFLREGQHVTVEVDAYPGRRWSGKLLLFRPALNPQTRTLTALIEVANPDLALRPQMYAEISVQAPGASNAVVVPQQAVLHSGERAVVIVSKGDGLFEPREVELGMSSGDMQQVTAGLSAGERIVTSSQFLIDSESNLKAAISQLLSGRESQAPADEPKPAPTPGTDHRH